MIEAFLSKQVLLSITIQISDDWFQLLHHGKTIWFIFFFVIQPFISVLLGIKKIVLAWTSFCLLYDTRTQNGYWTQSIFISCFTMFMLHYLPVLWGISLEWYSSSYWINYIEFAKFRAIIPHLILIDFFLWLWATECYQRTDFDLV